MDEQRNDLCAESGGALTLDAEESEKVQDSFETANSQGYRAEEDEAQDFPISMVHLGWLNVELKSDGWVKIMDQPPVQVMKIVVDEDKDRKKTKKFVNGDDGKGSSVKTYCVTGLEMSKQQELVEASFQMRCRIFEFNAVSLVAIPLELIPLEVDYVEALSNQEVPDYFAGPTMAKTVTQETRVVFGQEQEEWKAAILAELQSFAKLGVYERFPEWT